MWNIRTKEKLKEQNSSRITEPKNGLTVTKGKGTGEDGWDRTDYGGKRKWALGFSMYNVGESWGRLWNTEKTSSDSTASFYADEQ